MYRVQRMIDKIIVTGPNCFHCDIDLDVVGIVLRIFDYDEYPTGFTIDVGRMTNPELVALALGINSWPH